MAQVRIGVVGAGNVGATTALLLSQRGLGEVVLSDIVEDMPQGKALDLCQMIAAQGAGTPVRGTNRVADMRDCAVVVLTAGVPRKPGMTREQLLDVNARIVASVVDELKSIGATPILIVVTNPLDVMTAWALHRTGWGRARVFGMAGTLDSARMAWFIAERLGIGVEDVRAMVLGSHGDTMVALPRFTTVSGIPVTELLPPDDIEKICARTRDGGAEIVRLLKTGSAYTAPAAAIVQLVEAIITGRRRILPCAVELHGEYDLRDVVIGVPAVIGPAGVERVIELRLTDEERAALHRSADVVRQNIAVLMQSHGR